MDKQWHIHTMDYYSKILKYELLREGKRRKLRR
jgi:hypothetical protein